MASRFGRSSTGRRYIPSMEWALAGLLIALSIAGNATGLDYTVRSAAGEMIAAVYPGDRTLALGSQGPSEVVVRVRVDPPFDSIQAQAGKAP